MACKNKTVNKIVEILDQKKGMDIEVLDVAELTTLTDYFVIVSGGSERQVQALCDHVEEMLDKDGLSPVNKEGYRSGQWILLGYDEVIVHIFHPETRNFYDLERVWQDAPHIDISNLLI